MPWQILPSTTAHLWVIVTHNTLRRGLIYIHYVFILLCTSHNGHGITGTCIATVTYFSETGNQYMLVSLFKQKISTIPFSCSTIFETSNIDKKCLCLQIIILSPLDCATRGCCRHNHDPHQLMSNAFL
jgi:hypothetical protein